MEKESAVYDAVIFLPENKKYKEVIKINRILVENEIPYFISYYNGKHIVIGPFVHPWKTACLECHITHHVNKLKKNAHIDLSVEDIGELAFALAVPGIFSSKQLSLIARNICREIKKIKEPNAVFGYLEKELYFLPDALEGAAEKYYRPITDCMCCHGINKKFRFFSEAVKDEAHTDGEDIIENCLKYTVAGFRSVTKEETKRMVEKALINIGADVSTEKAKDNPFEGIIPVYDSILLSVHKNNTPYIFTEQYSHGKGINASQAYFSAAFELFERISCRYYGEKEVIRATPKQLGCAAVDLSAFANQIVNHDSQFEAYDENMEMDWTWGNSLVTGKKVLVPASMAFFSDVVFKGNCFCRSSTGLAAGSTLEDAILQGLFELIEHDAWMIGQANPIVLPEIDIYSSSNKELLKAVEKMKERGYQIISRNYTNDMEIPVIRTWIYRPGQYTEYATNGFGASISAEVALERSITEAIQSSTPPQDEIVTRFNAENSKDILMGMRGIYSLYYLVQKDIRGVCDRGKVKITDFETKEYSSVKQILADVVSKIRKAIPGCDVTYVNLTREAIGIPAVRVLITGDV